MGSCFKRNRPPPWDKLEGVLKLKNNKIIENSRELFRRDTSEPLRHLICQNLIGPGVYLFSSFAKIFFLHPIIFADSTRRTRTYDEAVGSLGRQMSEASLRMSSSSFQISGEGKFFFSNRLNLHLRFLGFSKLK